MLSCVSGTMLPSCVVLTLTVPARILGILLKFRFCKSEVGHEALHFSVASGQCGANGLSRRGRACGHSLRSASGFLMRWGVTYKLGLQQSRQPRGAHIGDFSETVQTQLKELGIRHFNRNGEKLERE